MKSVTLIVPCYNEADVLTMLLKELTRVTMPLSGQYCFKFLFHPHHAVAYAHMGLYILGIVALDLKLFP